MEQGEHPSRPELTDSELVDHLERRLQGIDVALVASVAQSQITLRGAVRSATQKREALGIARELAGARVVRDEIDVRHSEPGRTHAYPQAVQGPDAEIEVLDRYVTDITHTLEEGQPFFPPTDTVVVPAERGLEVRGGFSATSMDALTDEMAPELPEEGGLRGDEAIAEDIRRELAEDATTAHLSIEVAVTNGLVTLQGSVPHIEDADAVEEVASRVPGVVDVREHLSVGGL